MVGGHQLGDHPAHGGADDVGAVDTQRRQQAGRILGHVVQIIGDGGPLALGQGREDRRHVGGAGAVELFRKADVAIVEADHAEAARRQLAGEGRAPTGHLGAQAHDQEQRLGAGLAGDVVFEGEAVGLDLGHARLLEAFEAR